MHSCMHMHMYLHIWICTYIYAYMHTYMHTCIHKYMHTCVCVCVCMYVCIHLICYSAAIICVTCKFHMQSTDALLLFEIHCPKCKGKELKFQWSIRSLYQTKQQDGCVFSVDPHRRNLVANKGLNIKDGTNKTDEHCFVNSLYKKRSSCTNELSLVLQCTKLPSNSFTLQIQPSTTHLKSIGSFYQTHFATTVKVRNTAVMKNIPVYNIKPTGTSLTMFPSTEVALNIAGKCNSWKKTSKRRKTIFSSEGRRTLWFFLEQISYQTKRIN